MIRRLLTTLSLFAIGSLAAISPAAEPPGYNRDVRPILSDNCFRCHGPDEGERKAKFRLDVPGKLDTDEILARITATDPDDIMPPPESNKSLEPAEIETLKRWLVSGTPYEKHWAFVPPKLHPTPPGTNPIDHFIGRGLKEADLDPLPEADPHTLIRRVYLDLIGLPPTPAEADAFVAESIRNPQSAFNNAVDRLLASPQYGERWARRWLDLARYADTNGYEKDRNRSIWPYRDWVIRALNSDMPFDRFTVEQLAGDMLPNPTSDQLVATGFHRNTMLNEEGGIDPLEFRFRAMTDRIGTTGTTWLGLTVECAQCHTHKYDPITHHDYYGMMAYLNNADEPDYLIRDEATLTQHQKNLAEAERLISELPNHWPATTGSIDFKTMPLRDVATASDAVAEVAKDGTVLITGPVPETDTYTATFETAGQNLSALRLETLIQGGKGPGRTEHGNFVLSEIEITAIPRTGKHPGEKIEIASVKADVEQPGFEAALAVDGKLEKGWGIHDPGKTLNVDRAAIFHFAKPVGFKSGTRFVVRLVQNLGGKHTIGKFRLALGQPTEGDTKPSREELLEKAFARWVDDQRNQAVDWRPLEPAKLAANYPFLVHEGGGVIYAGGDTSKHDVYNLTFPPSSTLR